MTAMTPDELAAIVARDAAIPSTLTPAETDRRALLALLRETRQWINGHGVHSPFCGWVMRGTACDCGLTPLIVALRALDPP